jgi:hypothetical protein
VATVPHSPHFSELERPHDDSPHFPTSSSPSSPNSRTRDAFGPPRFLAGACSIAAIEASGRAQAQGSEPLSSLLICTPFSYYPLDLSALRRALGLPQFLAGAHWHPPHSLRP